MTLDLLQLFLHRKDGVRLDRKTEGYERFESLLFEKFAPKLKTKTTAIIIYQKEDHWAVEIRFEMNCYSCVEDRSAFPYFALGTEELFQFIEESIEIIKNEDIQGISRRSEQNNM